MQIAKLSLVAAMVVGLSGGVYAADTLADAFKNGKVNGELKAYYFDRDFNVAPDIFAASKGHADILTTGLALGYVTDSFNGFRVGTTMQSSYSPFADKEAKELQRNGGFGYDMYGSGAILSEAYVAYKMKNTELKVGRQFIRTPLVNITPARVVTSSYEGATLVNTDLPQTTLMAGVITKYQLWTDSSGNISDFVGLNDNQNAAIVANKNKPNDHAYTLLAINKSIPNIILTAQYLTLESNWDMYYGEINYASKLGDFSYGISTNYMYKDLKTSVNNENSGEMYGLKLDLGYSAFAGFLAYTRITDGVSLRNTFTGGTGLAAQPAYAKGLGFTVGDYIDDNSAYAVDLNYNFKEIGLLAGVRYVDFHYGSTSSSKLTTHLYDKSIMQLYGTYNFTNSLKGLSLNVVHETQGEDYDGQEFWFKASYKF